MELFDFISTINKKKKIDNILLLSNNYSQFMINRIFSLEPKFTKIVQLLNSRFLKLNNNIHFKLMNSIIPQNNIYIKIPKTNKNINKEEWKEGLTVNEINEFTNYLDY